MATVSLPSIHEMFPDHLIHDRDTARPSSSSLRGPSRNPHPTFSANPHTHHPNQSRDHHRPAVRDQETSGRRDRPLPYAYTVLRSSPTTTSLTHLASSSSRVPSGRSVGDVPFHLDSTGTAAGPSSHRQYPRPSTSGGSLGPQGQFSGAYIHSSHASHTRSLPPPISPVDGPSRRAKPTSGRAIAYEHGEMIMDTTPDPRDGSLDPDDDGEMNSQLGTGQGKKHICPSCFKRFNRPSSLRIHVNTHTGATPFRCPWPNCGREFNVNSNMRRHYRNHTTPGAPRGSGAARAAPPPPRIPPPSHSDAKRGHGPSQHATQPGPSSEDEEEFDELDSDMDVDPPLRPNGNAYPTPPLHRRRASRSPSYSPHEKGHPYVSSPPRHPSAAPRSDLVHARYQHSAVRDRGYSDPSYASRREREYSPYSSNGSPPSHTHRFLERREYDDDDDDEKQMMVHRHRRPMTPGSSFHSSSPSSPSVGGGDEELNLKERHHHQYNPSRAYEDAVKDGRVSTVLRRAVY